MKRITSIAFAINLALAGISFSSHGNHKASCPYRRSGGRNNKKDGEETKDTDHVKTKRQPQNNEKSPTNNQQLRMVDVRHVLLTLPAPFPTSCVFYRYMFFH